MKVLLFTTTLGTGGAERVLTLLANDLVARKHEIILLTLSGSEGDFYSVGPAVRRIGLGLTGPSSGMFDGILANIKRVRAIRSVFTRERPEAVISFLDSANILALAAGVCTKIPVIVSERVDPRAHKIGRLWTLLRRILYPFAARVVVQTVSAAEWARTVAPSSQVAVIPNPVIRPAFPALRRPLPDPIRIAGMGRMTHQKGFDILLRAVKSVNARGVKLFLSIYGEGPERANLEALAGSLGISHCVAFPGRTKDPATALADADIFVLSSRFEGFPNVLLEAMAVGAAAIAFDCPSGPAEIIENGVSGLLVPNGDLDRLSEAIARVATDPALRSALATGAFARAATFSTNKIVEQWERLLMQAARPK
jgi:glycosyltransferase involved in cell wall biosynthesis